VCEREIQQISLREKITRKLQETSVRERNVTNESRPRIVAVVGLFAGGRERKKESAREEQEKERQREREREKRERRERECVCE